VGVLAAALDRGRESATHVLVVVMETTAEGGGGLYHPVTRGSIVEHVTVPKNRKLCLLP
jgi:hypothetical protein